MNPLLTALVEAGVLPQADAARIDRQLDPEQARLHAERLLGESFQRGLSAQERRILDVLDDTQGQPTATQMGRLWASENELLWASVGDSIAEIAGERAVVAAMQHVVPGIAATDDMWMLVNQSVLDWVDDYYLDADGASFGSIPNLNLTAKTQFASAFRDWQLGELTAAGYQDGLPQLIRALESVFGATRAEAIGVTEVSRIFSMAELEAARQNEFVTHLLWETSVDERTCVICRPRHGTIVGKESDGFRVETDSIVGYPPAHVRCRCRLTSLTAPALEALRAEGFVHG